MVELVHTHKGTVYTQRNGVLIPVNTDGLVGYWPMTEGSGGTAYDESKNGNDGTINGASWTNTANGKALDFDGVDDYVEAGTTNFNVGIGSISIWYKFISTPDGPVGLWNIYTSDSDRMLIWYAFDPNTWRFRNRDSGILESGNTYTDTGWHHMVVTYDFTNDNYYMYIDGVQEDSSTTSYSSPSLVPTQQIGYYEFSGSKYYFNGTIDEVRIYNRALSAQEITNIYEKTRGIYGV